MLYVPVSHLCTGTNGLSECSGEPAFLPIKTTDINCPWEKRESNLVNRPRFIVSFKISLANSECGKIKFLFKNSISDRIYLSLNLNFCAENQIIEKFIFEQKCWILSQCGYDDGVRKCIGKNIKCYPINLPLIFCIGTRIWPMGIQYFYRTKSTATILVLNSYMLQTITKKSA